MIYFKRMDPRLLYADLDRPQSEHTWNGGGVSGSACNGRRRKASRYSTLLEARSRRHWVLVRMMRALRPPPKAKDLPPLSQMLKLAVAFASVRICMHVSKHGMLAIGRSRSGKVVKACPGTSTMARSHQG